MKRVTITRLRETHWNEKWALETKHWYEEAELELAYDKLHMKQIAEMDALSQRQRAEIEASRKQLLAERPRPAPEPKRGPENVVSFRQHRKRRQQDKSPA